MDEAAFNEKSRKKDVNKMLSARQRDGQVKHLGGLGKFFGNLDPRNAWKSHFQHSKRPTKSRSSGN